MKRLLHLMLIMLLVTPIEFSLISSASAAKTGSTCKKLNAKGWDGDKPIVCKKNKSGKLIWTVFGNSASTYNLSISLVVYESGLNTGKPELDPPTCGFTGKYKDLNKKTAVEVRDGNGNLLALGVLGSPTTTPNKPYNSDCLYQPIIKLKKSDFYQVKIGTRYDELFSFQNLVDEQWKIPLSIGESY